MVNLSINQILDVWSELEAACYGKNDYGGNTDEIYMYKFMPYDPLFVMYRTCGEVGAKSYESVIKKCQSINAWFGIRISKAARLPHLARRFSI